mmetsp:Transcript_10124/g.25733  ORF Transcript_10124/g.25733 Transcript_10124/m.25733 type:complete len:238 (-) Transcript_10124:506-1219(-)
MKRIGPNELIAALSSCSVAHLPNGNMTYRTGLGGALRTPPFPPPPPPPSSRCLFDPARCVFAGVKVLAASPGRMRFARSMGSSRAYCTIKSNSPCCRLTFVVFALTNSSLASSRRLRTTTARSVQGGSSVGAPGPLHGTSTGWRFLQTGAATSQYSTAPFPSPNWSSRMVTSRGALVSETGKESHATVTWRRGCSPLANSTLSLCGSPTRPMSRPSISPIPRPARYVCITIRAKKEK